MFSKQDISQIEQRGIELSLIRKQIDRFVHGFPYIVLDRPATPGDGILSFNARERDHYIMKFETRRPDLRIVKFVPASGVASRMFKHLFEFRTQYSPGAEGEKLFSSDQGPNSVHHLMSNLSRIAFYSDLAEKMAASGLPVDPETGNNDLNTIIDYILTGKGLDYANLPKALLKFHHYPEGARTAAEEHLVEAAEYTTDLNRKARIHFTISPEHREKFMTLFAGARDRYEKSLNVEFEISFSVQKPSTDTIAVDEYNQPFRNSGGQLLFRPGGHGALLENLNETDADLVFIKNIDNIVPDRVKGATYENKKLLGGYLLSMKETITGFLHKIKAQETTFEELVEMANFSREKLFIDLPPGFQSLGTDDLGQMLFKLLNRPVRVCGMVKNDGEPGGGPFWVRDADNKLSLQIVETSQVNMADAGQKAILEASTHFNPVDLVCSTRDYEGTPFDLKDFVDENTGLISLKSYEGKTLKAQELPGLWNGSMARWVTVFIEVPIATFNPVKTVNDLLRKEHLPG
jgi:hypothetical protein